MAVTIVVHRFEDSCDALNSTRGTLKDFSFDLCDQVLDAEGLELLHGDGIAGIGRVTDEPDVLVVLELGGHIASNISLVLQGQILGAVQNCERVAHDLLLATEVIRVALVIGGQVVGGAAVAEQDWLVNAHGLTLLLQAEVGVASVNNPNTGVALLSMHGSLVEPADWRVIVLALRCRAQKKLLAEGVWVALNVDFLAVANDIVRAEDVSLFNTRDFKHSTVCGSNTLIRCRGAHVALISAWQLVVGVECEPAVRLLVLEHEAVARSDASVGRVRPGHLLVGSLVHGGGLAERQLSSSLLRLVIGLSIGFKKTRSQLSY